MFVKLHLWQMQYFAIKKHQILLPVLYYLNFVSALFFGGETGNDSEIKIISKE